jgi:hypothetical protein
MDAGQDPKAHVPLSGKRRVVILSEAKDLQFAKSPTALIMNDQRKRTRITRQRRIRPDGQS